jgi:acyl carrier protein
MWNVLEPKVLGAWNLHVRTAGRQLDFFALFSSAASILGSPGQANYAAANAFLDALAQHRRARNLPAVSINWGPWSEIGMAVRESRETRLSSTGMGSIEPTVGLAILGQALSGPLAQLGVLPIEAAAWRRFAPAGQAPPYLAALVPNAGSESMEVPIGSALDSSALLQVPPDDWQPILERQLQEQAARVLRLPASELDVEQPLNNLGIDSLMAIELKNRIEADLGATVPMVKFLEGPSVRDLAGFLSEQLAPILAPLAGARQQRAAAANGQCANPATDAGPLTPANAGQLLARLDSLSDAEVDSLLSELCDAEKGD